MNLCTTSKCTHARRLFYTCWMLPKVVLQWTRMVPRWSVRDHKLSMVQYRLRNCSAGLRAREAESEQHLRRTSQRLQETLRAWSNTRRHIGVDTAFARRQMRTGTSFRSKWWQYRCASTKFEVRDTDLSLLHRHTWLCDGWRCVCVSANKANLDLKNCLYAWTRQSLVCGTASL